MQQQGNLSILITVFNRKGKTMNCLERLSKQTIGHRIMPHIYIIDGGSTDGTVRAVNERFPEVNIKVVDGVYWNRGMWHAWEWASSVNKYDYFIWLNDDTYLEDDAIQQLVDASVQKNDNSIIVGATVDVATRSKVTYGGRSGNGLVYPNGSMSKVERFNGNIVLVPSAIHKVLGNLDYYFTHSKGDIDYGKRARKAGYEIWQVGKPLGACDVHEHIDRWCDPQIPFNKRWKLLNMPNGMPPKETFHLEKRHDGLLKACIHYCTTILHCIFPSLWIALGKTSVPQ